MLHTSGHSKKTANTHSHRKRDETWTVNQSCSHHVNIVHQDPFGQDNTHAHTHTIKNTSEHAVNKLREKARHTHRFRLYCTLCEQRHPLYRQSCQNENSTKATEGPSESTASFTQSE